MARSDEGAMTGEGVGLAAVGFLPDEDSLIERTGAGAIRGFELFQGTSGKSARALSESASASAGLVEAGSGSVTVPQEGS